MQGIGFLTVACSVAQHQRRLHEQSVDLQSNTCRWYEQLSPFILVPRGSPFFPMSAHALSSNLTTIPSFLCTFFAVLTMMACLMSPLLTLFWAAAEVLPGPLSPIDLNFCTTTIMRSPCGDKSASQKEVERDKVFTDSAVSLHAEISNTFDECGSRIVNAVQHCLWTVLKRIDV